MKHPLRRRRRRQRSAAGTLLRLLPGLRERHAPTFVVVNGENVAGGARHHAEDRRRAVRGRRRRDHARQPRLPPRARSTRTSTREPRILRPANFLRSQPGHGTCVVERDGVRLGVVNLSRQPLPARRPLGLRRGRRRARRAARQGRPRARRHARRGDEREGRDGLAPRRPRDRRRRHAHARPDRRRARAAGGTAYITDVGMTGAARRRDRRQARAGDRGARDADAGALRDLRGGPVADGRRRARLLTPLRADAIEQVLDARPAGFR